MKSVVTFLTALTGKNLIYQLNRTLSTTLHKSLLFFTKFVCSNLILDLIKCNKIQSTTIISSKGLFWLI